MLTMGSWLTTACTSASLCVMSTTDPAVRCSSARACEPHSLACSQKLGKRRLRRSACVRLYTLCIRLYTPEARLAALLPAATMMAAAAQMLAMLLTLLVHAQAYMQVCGIYAAAAMLSACASTGIRCYI